MKICVFAASSNKPDPTFKEAAALAGTILAAHGHSLVFGGGAQGLMGAIAKTAHEGGTRILGIAPKLFDKPGVLFKDCDQFIFSMHMRERKELMEVNSDACLVLPGGIGTYDEFFELVTLKQLGQTDRPIVVLNTNGYFNKLQKFLEASIEDGFISSDVLKLYTLADTPEEAFEALESYEKRGNEPIFDLGNH